MIYEYLKHDPDDKDYLSDLSNEELQQLYNEWAGQDVVQICINNANDIQNVNIYHKRKKIENWVEEGF